MKSYTNINLNQPALFTQVYDKDKLTVGDLIRRKDGYLTPMPMALARPMEAAVAIPIAFPMAVEYDADTQYVFGADMSTAAATRRIVMYEFNKQTSSYTWKGFITVTFPVATTHTIRGMRVIEYLNNTGKVTVAGTTVTGTGTNWKNSGFAVGSRIGFATKEHTEVTRWYEIADIPSNTELTLSTPVSESVSNQDFVIEEVRVLIATTNATAANGGLFLVKGVHYDSFVQGGLTIPAATTVDNIRACYWLADAAVVTNTVAGGVALDDMVNFGEQYAYVLQGSTNIRIFKYNIRKPLTNLTAGKSVDAFDFATGIGTLTGTVSQNNNGRLATAQHGVGAGQKSLYFVTTTRLYRIALSNIQNGSTTFISDSMAENPAGGTTSFLVGAGLSSVEYSGVIDAFVVNSTALGRSYITKYKTDGSQFDVNFLSDNKQVDPSTSSPETPFYPSISGCIFSSWVESGIMHTIKQGTTSTLNNMYAIAVGADSVFTDNQSIITPAVTIPNLKKFDKVVIDDKTFFGSDRLGVSAERYNLYYRTNGITDNSGTWISCDSGDLSGVSGNQIQFKITFRVAGTTCITAQVRNIVVTYEDRNTDSHYLPSNKYSSTENSTLAYRQSEQFEGVIPDLTVKLYNVETNILILSDTITESNYGVWEYSPNGTTWMPFDYEAANAIGNYIRYKANGLPAGLKIKSVLQVS